MRNTGLFELITGSAIPEVCIEIDKARLGVEDCFVHARLTGKILDCSHQAPAEPSATIWPPDRNAFELRDTRCRLPKPGRPDWSIAVVRHEMAGRFVLPVHFFGFGNVLALNEDRPPDGLGVRERGTTGHATDFGLWHRPCYLRSGRQGCDPARLQAIFRLGTQSPPMTDFVSIECANCSSTFKAHESARAAANRYCSPACHSAGDGVA